MTLINEQDEGLISEMFFFANIFRCDCSIHSLFEKSTFPHHLTLYTPLEVNKNQFQNIIA